MFEKATRMKLRFQSNKGLLSVEDLWDLPLTSTKGDSLDTLAIKYNKEIKETEELSFVEEVRKDSPARLMLDILKHIIGVKLNEKKQREKDAENKKERERLLGIVERKQHQADEELSIAELLEKANKL